MDPQDVAVALGSTPSRAHPSQDFTMVATSRPRRPHVEVPGRRTFSARRWPTALSGGVEEIEAGSSRRRSAASCVPMKRSSSVEDVEAAEEDLPRAGDPEDVSPAGVLHLEVVGEELVEEPVRTRKTCLARLWPIWRTCPEGPRRPHRRAGRRSAPRGPSGAGRATRIDAPRIVPSSWKAGGRRPQSTSCCGPPAGVISLPPRRRARCR